MFSKKNKGPQDSTKTLKENLLQISKLDNQTDKKYIKLSDDISATLVSIKTMLYGGQDGEPQSDQTAQVAQEIYQSEVLTLLFENLPRLEFEARKDSGAILGNLLRRKIGTHYPTVDYICNNNTHLLMILMTGYTNPEVALNCGTMLRDCIRHERLAIIVLNFENFYKFFDYVEMSAFDIASDAFSTFKELLTRHKMVAADFLEANYALFFKNYDRLLSSGSYVTRRQALKLLGELLLDRHNFSIMTKYISSPENLKLMMNMLKEKSKNIQFEAFHVFKVFVANPNKPQPIQEILYRNQEKLIEYLSKFHNDRTDDEQFIDEKTYLIKQIKEMRPPEQ